MNTLTKADTSPLPRVDDSADHIRTVSFISKIDLVKGYWQVYLTERAKKIASFVAKWVVYQYQVMPYRQRNAPATFQRLLDRIPHDLTHNLEFIDDVVIYEKTWAEHLPMWKLCLHGSGMRGSVVNMEKCELVKA